MIFRFFDHWNRKVDRERSLSQKRENQTNAGADAGANHAEADIPLYVPAVSKDHAAEVFAVDGKIDFRGASQGKVASDRVFAKPPPGAHAAIDETADAPDSAAIETLEERRISVNDAGIHVQAKDGAAIDQVFENGLIPVPPRGKFLK